LELDFSRFPILVVDDEQDNLDAFRFVFRKSFALTYAQGGEQALASLETLDPAVIVTDQRMPGMSGIDVLKHATKLRPDAVGVLLTAYTDMPVLLEAINSGAVYRYVQKPWDSKELAVVLKQSIERFHTLRENRRLREQLARYAGYLEAEQRDPMDFGELAAESAPMRAATSQLDQLSGGTGPVLVSGEPGTEKELFARALHVSSPRESKPFVVVSCPSFSSDALERELFGWERGAFDGAMVDRPGRLELAHEGTLVLSELGDLSPALAARLERLLENGSVRRLGAASDARVDVRLVATTSLAPSAFMTSSAFARGLAAAHVVVPPLRARLDDLPAICTRLLVRAALRHGRPARGFSPEAIAKLMTYRWPGNLAELASVVERAALTCEGATVGPAFTSFADAGASSSPDAPPATPVAGLPAQLDDLERRELCSALERCGGNKAEVARILGIQRTTLYYRLKRLGIEV
jgi:two-component system response regulator AtoC/two-component system response regulator HupR/HoxA